MTAGIQLSLKLIKVCKNLVEQVDAVGQAGIGGSPADLDVILHHKIAVSGHHAANKSRYLVPSVGKVDGEPALGRKAKSYLKSLAVGIVAVEEINEDPFAIHCRLDDLPKKTFFTGFYVGEFCPITGFGQYSRHLLRG